MNHHVIYRYEVPVDDAWHEYQGPGVIVHVATRRRDSVEFWAITGLHAGRIIRRLRVFATGQPFPEHLSYVGTAITPDGTLVWHLMEDPGGSE